MCTFAGAVSGNSEISTGAAVGITFVVTFIVSVTVTAIITYIVAYVYVKRRFKKSTNTQNPKHHGLQEKVLYEEMELPGSTMKELQPSPAYSTSHKVKMDTNPAYESSK